MLTSPWQKSSYCAEGNSCVHVARDGAGTIRLTESSDPRRAILGATPDAFRDFLRLLKEAPGAPVTRGPRIELTFGADDSVQLCETGDPATVVTTTRKKWDAFVLGVRAGEFDHFVAGLEEERS
ncbi:MAG: hypothetical protein QOC85_2062 [Streptomyces sp.]|nr:hypothetical protein [Streptomyces sp.]